MIPRANVQRGLATIRYFGWGTGGDEWRRTRARVLLRFDGDVDGLEDDEVAAEDRLRRELSACAQDRDGNLWLGTDELAGLSRLRPEAPGAFGRHTFTDLAGLLSLPDDDDEEIDIEGLAVHGRRLLLGLRGPVLRGWALLLELQVADTDDGWLCLEPIGDGGRPYRKHFVQLGGMGIRDLVWHGDDLLLLAGPTMDITGLQSLYRFRGAADLDDDSLSPLDGDTLSLAYHLPLVTEGDKAEGLCLFSGLDAPGLLVVYDAPCADRLVAADAVLADLFELPR